MRAFFFGDGSRQRLAVHHDAPRETSDTAVLICAPIGQEYIRTHWALRKMATELCRAGFPVLRFDYTGIGDSAGDLSEASVDMWTEDVCDAAEALRDACGASRVSILGLRFGAALAALAAAGELKVKDLVLWDPVVSGAEYVASMKQMHQRMLVDPNRWPQPQLDRARRGDAPQFPSTSDELLGFHFPPTLVRDIEAVDLTQRPPTRARRVLVLSSRDAPEVRGLCAALRAVDVPNESRMELDAGDWDDPGRVEDALICETIPHLIVSFFSQRSESTAVPSSRRRAPA